MAQTISRQCGGDALVHQVYLSLGANCENADEQLSLALERIAALPEIAIQKVSGRYVTEPQGDADQPWFTNMAVALWAGTSWTAPTLLGRLLDVEKALGRVRDAHRRFGPRAIDIDMLLFDAERSGDPCCILPHPRMAERAFVLVPLMEVAPQLKINGMPIDSLLKNINYRLVERKIYQ